MGKDRFKVEKPLDEVFGDDYQTQVSGVSRVGSSKNPTGSTNTDFTKGGTVKGIYEIKPDDTIGTHTLYPTKAKTD